MAGVDFSQSILGAGASVKTDFAAAQARTEFYFIGNERFKREIKAFANASAELSKFVHASIEGTNATVLTLNYITKMNRKFFSDKPYLLYSAKAKEKQRHPRSNANLLHIFFCINRIQ